MSNLKQRDNSRRSYNKPSYQSKPQSAIIIPVASSSQVHQAPTSTGSRYGANAEHSLERLKSQITDLKKIASSKVKKTAAAASNSNLTSNSNLHGYGQYEKYQSRYDTRGSSAHANAQINSGLQQNSYYGHQPRGSSVQGKSQTQPGYQKQSSSKIGRQGSRDQLAHQQQKSQDKYATGKYAQTASYQQQTQSSGYSQQQAHSTHQADRGPERKQNNTKTANALKKYIHEIEQFSSGPPQSSKSAYAKDRLDSQREKQATYNNFINPTQQRSVTTKKARPQSGKPSTQTHAESQQQIRGGSLKREMYQNSHNIHLQGSSSKYKKPSATTQSTKNVSAAQKLQKYPATSASYARAEKEKTTGQRKAQSQDPRDRYAHSYQQNSQMYGSSIQNQSRQVSDHRYNATQQQPTTSYRNGSNTKKSSTQNLTKASSQNPYPSQQAHSKTQRPQSGYIMSPTNYPSNQSNGNVVTTTAYQPRSNSTSYIQKQASFHHQQQNVQQVYPSSVKADQRSQSTHARQQDKYEASKVIQHKYPSDKQHFSKVISERSGQEPPKKTTSTYRKENVVLEAGENLAKKYGYPQEYQESSPQFSQPKQQHPKTSSSSQKDQIMNQYQQAQVSEYKTQSQQNLEKYPQHSQRIKSTRHSANVASSNNDSQSGVINFYQDQQKKLISHQEEAGESQEHSRQSYSQSQQSMMGANHEFKDGQTNKVHNLMVNMSPTTHVPKPQEVRKAEPSKDKNSISSISKGVQPPQMGGSRAPLHQTSKMSQGANPASNLSSQLQHPQTIYSLQQAAGGNYNSLSQNPLGAGNHTLGYMVGNQRTLIVTREDFNIEDIHCQLVFKVQREQQLLREIEGGEEPKSIAHETNLSNGPHSSMVEQLDGSEILSSDMCSKPAINWGKKAQVLAFDQPRQRQMRQISNHHSSQHQYPSSHQPGRQSSGSRGYGDSRREGRPQSNYYRKK